jgi:hypothetical protein
MTKEIQYCWHCSCELVEWKYLTEDGELSDCPPQPTVFSVAVYLVDKQFGGHEEGGWWYDAGYPVLDADLPLPLFFKNYAEARLAVNAMQKTLDAGVNVGRRSIGSVLSEGVYRACVEAGLPKPFPETRPYYE